MTNKRSLAKNQWTPDQLEEKLQEQLYFVRSSCSAIDSGIQIEAIRLAVSLRTLLHHTLKRDGTPNSSALLNMLGLRETIQWVDQSIQNRAYFNDGMLEISITAHLGNGNNISIAPTSQDGLVDIQSMHGIPSNVPAFLSHDHRDQLVSFEEWWNHRFIATPDGLLMSRADLVLEIANTDGGSHVDSIGLRNHYARLKNEGHGLYWSNSGHPSDMIAPSDMRPALGDAAALSVRHIAHEVLLTLTLHGVVESPYG